MNLLRLDLTTLNLKVVLNLTGSFKLKAVVQLLSVDVSFEPIADNK